GPGGEGLGSGGDGTGGGLGGPGSGNWGGGGLEGFKGSFDAYLGVLKRTGLDVVFVFDSTGSMEWVIEPVKAKIASLMGVIKRLVPIARLGIVAYRDWGEEYVTRMQDLTTDSRPLKEFLNGVKAEAGGDWEEAVEEALRVAIEKARWRKGSKKMIILIGDAPPHKKDLPKALNLVDKFQQQGGVVSAIDTSHETNDQEFSNYDSTKILPEFVAITARGKGETTNLQDKKIIQQLAILTFGSRWKEAMEEYIGDL
ncbi:MAG: VWA domain-containing protein, partial [Candidatus Tectomicrobia bacterium]|nr:VWA domain-containing protein [Candidatus Tectomicrobia bacterium]